MNPEDKWLKNRFIELAENAYQQNHYTFSTFLTLAEQDLLIRTMQAHPHIDYTLFGGHPSCERRLARFGSAKLFGYEEAYPIEILAIQPLAPKFSRQLTHRDFLGAILNLGIDRHTTGDIFTKDTCANVFCLNTISRFITDNLVKVANTQISCQIITQVKEEWAPQLKERLFSVPSERMDALIAALYKLSRSQSQELFQTGKVFINGKLTENSSAKVKEKDIISVRGKGRFYYQGIEKETKKGRFLVTVHVFE